MRREPLSLKDPGIKSWRFLSREASSALADRILKMGSGKGSMFVTMDSTWTGNVRWARNVVSTGGDSEETTVTLTRGVRGTAGSAETNALDDATLRAAVERAEAIAILSSMSPDDFPDTPAKVWPITEPKIWFDSTYNVDAEVRGRVAADLVVPAREAGVSSAGYIQVSGRGAVVRNSETLFRYYPFTQAQYSVTVRDPKHGASGWAGVDYNDWDLIDTKKISNIALEKCIQSRNPVAVEPGRFTAILEPQALCDMLAPLFERGMDRENAERDIGPFAAGRGNSKIGQKVLDERITLRANPMDPDCGFVPFDWRGEPYLDTKWIENGVLRALAYGRGYGLQKIGDDRALPNSYAFSMSGGTSSIEEMIATTKRGILVTRFNNVQVIDINSMLLTGTTRDGLWLIENGKINKAIKNFRITESPLFILNNVEQIGRPQRVFRPSAPAVCPPVKVRDFSFTGMMDAV